jgi:hypothetical protein
MPQCELRPGSCRSTPEIRVAVQLHAFASTPLFQQHPAWGQRLEDALAAGRIGDALVLTDEAPVPALHAQAWIMAAEALQRAGHDQLAHELITRAREHYRQVPPQSPDDQQTAAALARIEALEQGPQPDAHAGPRSVFLFSGHVIDAPDRDTPRFPADKEPIAAAKIGEVLDALRAGAQDIAFSQAAAGGDLLFLEACQQRGVRCHVLLPFPEPQFIEKSILRSANAEQWRTRFFAMQRRLLDPCRVMPEALGPPPEGVDPYERCNQWLLYSALVNGVDKVRLIVLWNGSGGDGPGGTAHMHREVERRGGQVTWLDTRKLW